MNILPETRKYLVGGVKIVDVQTRFGEFDEAPELRVAVGLGPEPGHRAHHPPLHLHQPDRQQLAVELETKVHPKIRNHREGSY